MKLTDFGYTLPEALIAQTPLKRRDQARLLVIDRKQGTISHDIFAHIDRYLPPKSVLVVNNSKVVHARLLGARKTGGVVEIFLLKRLEDGKSYEALLRPLKKIKEGEEILLADGKLTARLIDKEKRIVQFTKKNLKSYLTKLGHIPLPPYIKREDTASDKTYYQTVYASQEGSVAAPTAGLHFTKPLIAKMTSSGHRFEKITLHINYGTFKPVEEADITRHQMHEEEYAVASRTWTSLQRARSKGQSIVAVGTTSCRVLETLAETGRLAGTTNKFIYPGYQFRFVDALMTNFHLPFSTLLMLVSAFGGHQRVMNAYQEAINEKYRFYSYGDAMLII